MNVKDLNVVYSSSIMSILADGGDSLNMVNTKEN